MMEPRVSVVLPVFGGHRAAPALRAWRVARELTCLHFEHPRTHTAASFPGNHTILDERRAAGAEAMLAEDRASAGGTP